MRQCAFLTLDEPGDFVIDDEHAIAPMAALGWEVSTLSWRQDGIPWDRFEAVIIRSTWDYWNDVPAFLETLGQINRQTRLANPLDLVHWNLAKTYLLDLEAKGIGVVPTLWLEDLSDTSAAEFADRLGTDQLVVKPVIGANGQDAFRFARQEDPARWADIIARFPGRACMVQPFMPGIVGEGEFSLFFFNSRFSHATLRIPAANEFRSQEERGAEVRAIDPEDVLLLRGQQAIAALSTPPLYARIDFVRNAAGDFDVMELELIEPSLYLRMDPEAPARFAGAIVEWVESASPSKAGLGYSDPPGPEL